MSKQDIEKKEKFLKRFFIFIKNYFYSLYIFFRYFYNINLFFKSIINKNNIFRVGNGAIGHYPINFFISKQLYDESKNIYLHTKNIYVSNEYLFNKMEQSFNFNPKYENIPILMKAFSILTFKLFKFNSFPEMMNKNENFHLAFDRKSKLFEFNKYENEQGNNFLKKYGININKFICIHIRSSEYYINLSEKLNQPEMAERENILMNYRNVDPSTYFLTIQYLIDSGYYVIRMGKDYTNKLNFNHPKFIDYALSEDRSDFLDIWLSANCYFSISSSSGIGGVPLVFNRPFIETNQSEIARTQSWATKHTHLPRICKINNKLLNLNDLIKYNVIAATNGENYKKHNIELLENKPEEILEAIKDLENKIKNGFNNSKKNQKFWKNLEQEWSKNNHITQQWRPDINNKFVYFHDIKNIKSSIPDFFLEKYRNVFLDY